MKAGWSKRPLGELCSIQSGSSNTQDAVSDGAYVLFDRSKTPKRSNRYLFDCEALIIAGEGAEFKPKKYHGKFDLHQRAYAIYGFGDCLIGDYLYYYLEHVHEYFQKVAVGATVKSLRQRHFDQLPVLLPKSLDEQRRIVAMLDKAFAGIAIATAHAQKNLTNAYALFESYLEEKLAKPSSSAVSNILADLCAQGRIITYGVIKLGYETPRGVPCLRTSNVRWLHIDQTGIKRIEPSLSNQYRRTILEGGEVLVNVRGTLGGVAVVTDEMLGWNVSREVAVVPVAAKSTLPNYLAFWIGKKTSQEWLTGVQKGAAYSGINIEDLRQLKVNVPSINEQRVIVEQLSNVQQKCDDLADMTKRKLSALSELKQSLLQKAFAGALT